MAFFFSHRQILTGPQEFRGHPAYCYFSDRDNDWNVFELNSTAPRPQVGRRAPALGTLNLLPASTRIDVYTRSDMEL